VRAVAMRALGSAQSSRTCVTDSSKRVQTFASATQRSVTGLDSRRRTRRQMLVEPALNHGSKAR
jgi:hypothetical protein